MKAALVLLASALLAPAAARADTIAGLGFVLGPEAADIAIRGSAPLSHPRIATSPGLVRLWFAGNEEYVHLNQRGDGQAIRKIRVRPGAQLTHLVQIYLGDERRLDPGAVRVEVAGPMAHVRIARADLPAPPPPAPAPSPAQAAAPPAAPEAPAPTESASTVAASRPAPDASAVSAALPALQAAPRPTAAAPAADAESPAATAAEAAAPPPHEAAPPAPRPSTRRAAPLPAPRGPGILVYALLTLGLAGALLVVRLVRRARVGGPDRPTIEVVAARRLGPRHQIVVVRAFGRDHLLSVNGGATQRIASIRTAAAPLEVPQVPKAKGGLFSKPWIDRGLSREHDDDATEPSPRRSPAEAQDPAFGAELLHLASATRSRGAAPTRSDSVSGLLRLRQQAGK